jgi:methionyl-tRNA formyltransferase
MNYIIATIKPWNIDNYKKCFGIKNNFFLISEKEHLTYERLNKINPKYIFFPHWSWIIPEEIWSNFNCVVFHMTDLPYGRGGTPLQNLIVRGHKKTKISAIKVDGGLDTGGIYIKENLSLAGKAESIYRMASQIIFKKMIPHLIKNNPIAVKQTGKIVKFKRRKMKQSKILQTAMLDKIYDTIRMLDADGYPKAFLETKKIKFSFFDVKKGKNKLIAKVEIYEK